MNELPTSQPGDDGFDEEAFIRDVFSPPKTVMQVMDRWEEALIDHEPEFADREYQDFQTPSELKVLLSMIEDYCYGGNIYDLEQFSAEEIGYAVKRVRQNLLGELETKCPDDLSSLFGG